MFAREVGFSLLLKLPQLEISLPFVHAIILSLQHRTHIDE